MDALIDFLRELLAVTAEAAPYLLVGFALAGLVKVLLPETLVRRKLGGERLGASLRAALYGAPLPLCLCSVLPTATALRRAGAGRGPTAAFLISTPETGVDSIAVTWALLDPVMTVARPVAAVTTALVAGGVVSRVGGDPQDQESEEEPSSDATDACCSSAACDGSLDAATEPAAPPARRGLLSLLGDALRYAFGPLLDDLTPSLAVGLLLSGLIAVLVPADWLGEVVPGRTVAMLLALAVSAPLYVCATASTPLAAALVAKGLDPGAALVLLLAGPATNIASLAVVRRVLGGRAMAAYIGSIVVVSLVLGYATSELYRAFELDLPGRVSAALHEGPGAAGWVAAGLLALLMLASARRIVAARRAAGAGCCDDD
jgi:uncharacterized membrane protein YraQ (UPF0718 family)